MHNRKEKKPHGKLVWFHAASVGELMSIIPILEKFEKIKEIKINSYNNKYHKFIKSI